MRLLFNKNDTFVLTLISVLSIGACSETAMRSALYEPDKEDSPPATLDNPKPKASSPDTGIVTGTPSTPVEFEPYIEGLDTANTLSSNPNNSLNDFRKNPTHLGMLSQVTSEQLLKNPRAELDSVALELRTFRIHTENSEVHLEGYLVLRSEGPKVERLLNDGPVVISAAGERDILMAQFRRGNQIFSLEMERKSARNTAEVLAHPWSGQIYLIDQERGRIQAAILKGFIEHF